MAFRARYTEKSVRDLEKLDRQIARRIVGKVDWYCATGEPLKHAKQLASPFWGVWRFRIGDWRVLFEVSPRGVVTVLLILTVKHRREAYE